MADTKSQFAKFRSQARKILWASDSEHKAYYEWEGCIEKAMKRFEWTRPQATIQMAKDYKQLKDLFTIYDVADLDPAPDMKHGKFDVHSTDKQKAAALVKCEDKDIPYREQLRWALDTAGRYASDKEEPDVCPCWGAYYLYVQARENPKEFMAKVGQVESKSDADADRVAGHKQSSKRNVEEINEMLDALFNEEEPEEEEE